MTDKEIIDAIAHMNKAKNGVEELQIMFLDMGKRIIQLEQLCRDMYECGEAIDNRIGYPWQNWKGLWQQRMDALGLLEGDAE